MNIINKRLLKELNNLYKNQNSKQLLNNDYLIHFDENDLSKINVLIKPPNDSVYRHKFIRLDIKIPDNYPHSPPEVNFVNYDGTRIHPNMYETGKCCATILNTWGDSKYEKWTSSMGIETIILTFHSFLDNNPYKYEPGDRDDPSYTVYVKHQTWITCLIRYLQNETIDIFKEYINNYLLINIGDIFNELMELRELYPYGYYYTKCFEIDNYIINYDYIMEKLQDFYNYIDYTDKINTDIGFLEFCNNEYSCNICYDTDENQCNLNKFYNLNCLHKFHKECLKNHIENNNNVCPMCRYEITDDEVQNIYTDIETEITEVNKNDVNSKEINNNLYYRDEPELWIINPLTRRRVKKGSKTYKQLLKENVITEL